MYMYVNVYIYISISVDICTYTYLNIYTYIYIHVYIPCMYEFVNICILGGGVEEEEVDTRPLLERIGDKVCIIYK
jgi:hypothetical protein